MEPPFQVDPAPMFYRDCMDGKTDLDVMLIASVGTQSDLRI